MQLFEPSISKETKISLTSVLPHFPSKISEYKILKKIYNRNTAEIFEVELPGIKDSGTFKAILKTQFYSNPDAIGLYAVGLIEADIMKRLKHPSLMNAFHIFIDHDPLSVSSKICILMEKAAEDLTSFIDKPNKSNSKAEEVIGYIHDILRGLKFLHDEGYVHGDMKPHNILVFEQNERTGRRTAKISDFGLTGRIVNTTCSLMTPFFRAPELIENPGTYTYAIDMWGLGMIIFFILYDENPIPIENDQTYLETVKRILGKEDTDSDSEMEEKVDTDSDTDSDSEMEEKVDSDSKRSDPIDMKQSFVDRVKAGTREGEKFIDLHIAYSKKLLSSKISSRSEEENKTQYEAIIQLMERCFTLDPNDRITADEALQLPLFQDISFLDKGDEEKNLSLLTSSTELKAKIWDSSYLYIDRVCGNRCDREILVIDLYERYISIAELNQDQKLVPLGKVQKEKYALIMSACVIIANKMIDECWYNRENAEDCLKSLLLGVSKESKYTVKDIIEIEKHIVMTLKFCLYPDNILTTCPEKWREAHNFVKDRHLMHPDLQKLYLERKYLELSKYL